MSKKDRSHRKGMKTSTKDQRKLLKKQQYAAMRQSSKGTEVNTTTDGNTYKGLKSTGMRHCAHKQREKRRAEALARKKISDKQTPAERLALLNYRLGVGQGAKKERKRLGA